MRWTTLGIIVLLVVVPPSQAQEPQADETIYEFDLVFEPEPVFVPFGGTAGVPVTLVDRSKDSTATLGEPAGAPSVLPLTHTTSFSTEFRAPNGSVADGWLVRGVPQPVTRGGDEETVTINVLASRKVVVHSVLLDVTAAFETRDGTFFRNFTLQFFTDGIDGFSARLGQSIGELEPSQVKQASIVLSNPGLFPATYHTEITNNRCGLSVVAPASISLGPREMNKEVFFSVRGATDQVWYFTEDCGITLEVFPADVPNQVKTISLGAVVNGGYLDPELVFTILAIAAAILLLAFFLTRRKAAVEEELLGKPQRPWTIPVERVYLEHLQERDPRAAYVVRHFLMEEEYQSSLLWYSSYKHATKGTRSKERVVVTQEKNYERFTRKWKKKIARPQTKADRFEAKLQKKLDRQGKRGVRKQRRKWKKQVAKIEKAFEAKHEKQLKKWEKQAEKAEKKGLEIPEKPERGTPDLPPEPSLQRIMLADHKWNKKAERFRRKMVKKEGNLEVKFEKKDARMLHKMEKKVQRIARKLDDPEFAAEHPLVGKQAD